MTKYKYTPMSPDSISKGKAFVMSQACIDKLSLNMISKLRDADISTPKSRNNMRAEILMGCGEIIGIGEMFTLMFGECKESDELEKAVSAYIVMLTEDGAKLDKAAKESKSNG